MRVSKTRGETRGGSNPLSGIFIIMRPVAQPGTEQVPSKHLAGGSNPLRATLILRTIMWITENIQKLIQENILCEWRT